MATVANTTYPSYASVSSIRKYWLDTIAPNYFDFDNVNNYSIGIFGYINEVMGNTAEDTFNSVAIIRRETYPVTAQFLSSLYTMATLQSIAIPLTKPSTCRAILILPQNEVINNSTRDTTTGNYECVIDDTLQIFAGDLQFMLDYPIKIISRQNSTNKLWSHTVHYDINKNNSLNTLVSDRYISSKVLNENGAKYVALFIDTIRQLTMEEKTQIVVKDTILDTVTMDIDFDGNLANFEVFYKESANAEELQLEKVMINAPTPDNIAYVQYELVNTNKIRLTFEYNTYWNPKFNSEIIIRIYTSEGANGNFNQFTEDLVCSSNSEKYPYNSNMTILGRISGSAVGGADQDITNDFRNKVVKAYATNNTITTENDLQLYFDDISNDINGTQILFRKKRDDVYIRLYGAYSVYRDDSNNIIPTNTLQFKFEKEDILPSSSDTFTYLKIPAGSTFQYAHQCIVEANKNYYTDKACTIIAGQFQDETEVKYGNTSYCIWEYIDELTSEETTYYVKTSDVDVTTFLYGEPIMEAGAVIGETIEGEIVVVEVDPNTRVFKNFRDVVRENTDENDIYFTNPFMMILNTNPNACGYYLTSVEHSLPIEYRYINDGSMQQFIASTIGVYRNALAGNNFYRIRIKVSPTYGDKLYDPSNPSAGFVILNSESLVENQIRATSRGVVMKELYDQASRCIKYYVKYDTGETIAIQGSSIFNFVSATSPTDEDHFEYITGYKMKFNVGDTFNANDLLAVKRCDDLGKVVLSLDFGDRFHNVQYCAPMTIQDIDESSNSLIMEAYIATDDEIDSTGQFTINGGIYDDHGQQIYSVAIPMQDLTLTIDALYKDDDATITSGVTISNEKYVGIMALENYILTNTYISSDDQPFDMIVPLNFIRSVLSLYPINPLGPIDDDNFYITIDEIPLIGARWAADRDQFDYFIQLYTNVNEGLNGAYLTLNNTFSIDSKFYNTYGKARFYTVGNSIEAMTDLDNVRCSFHFGVKLTTISNLDDFITRFRNYVREYIESSDRTTTDGRDIYIMSLISDLKENFSEIIYMEYYGFNDYDYSAQKIIGPDLSVYQSEFIPEFLNLNMVKDANGDYYPDIVVDILT